MDDGFKHLRHACGSTPRWCLCRVAKANLEGRNGRVPEAKNVIHHLSAMRSQLGMCRNFADDKVVCTSGFPKGALVAEQEEVLDE